ncbi:MAG: hypothetical protein LBV51_02575 [Acholeplasmatales bacterium]|jgi:hypothetical protein|nr:hypothetical protein [Acholeplasmatales bacterium]
MKKLLLSLLVLSFSLVLFSCKKAITAEEAAQWFKDAPVLNVSDNYEVKIVSSGDDKYTVVLKHSKADDYDYVKIDGHFQNKDYNNQVFEKKEGLANIVNNAEVAAMVLLVSSLTNTLGQAGKSLLVASGTPGVTVKFYKQGKGLVISAEADSSDAKGTSTYTYDQNGNPTKVDVKGTAGDTKQTLVITFKYGKVSK